MPKKTNHQSLPNLLEALWLENFFSQERDPLEISTALTTKGYHFPASNLGVALIRTVRSGKFLSRIKNDNKWRYVQKYPTTLSGHKMAFFAGYDLHPQVKTVSLKQFGNNDFKGAIQNALVEVVDQVKIKAGNPKNKNGRELDGDDLMNHVFGCDNHRPKIKFNDLKTSLDKAEQRGLMNLYKGIVGVRDKKAHLNFIQHDPLKTIEYLSLASLLLRLLDENSPVRKHK